MRATGRAVTGVGRMVAVVVASTVLLGCSSTPPSPAKPDTTGAITRVGDDFLELAGGDIFGDVAAGGGSVWMATAEGLIQVDPVTMEATWHTDLAPGHNIVYAFDSLWVSVSSGVVRVDPASLEEIATIRIDGAGRARGGRGQHLDQSARLQGRAPNRPADEQGRGDDRRGRQGLRAGSADGSVGRRRRHLGRDGQRQPRSSASTPRAR